MAILNATDVVISIHDTAGTAHGSVVDKLLFATSASLSISRDLRDSTNKSSSGWSESLAGLKSWEMSGDGFVEFTNAEAATKNIKELFSQMVADNPEVTVKFSDDTTYYVGNAFITSLSVDAGVEENATYSISLTGSGELTQG